MPTELTHYRSPSEDSGRWLGFRFLPSDIVISTRRKTGTTWLQMICALLVFQTPELPEPLRYLSPWLDNLDAPHSFVYDQLAQQEHRRFIKTHTPLDGIPVLPRVTYIVAARQPLDTYVSLCRHNEIIGPPPAGSEPPVPDELLTGQHRPVTADGRPVPDWQPMAGERPPAPDGRPVHAGPPPMPGEHGPGGPMPGGQFAPGHFPGPGGPHPMPGGPGPGGPHPMPGGPPPMPDGPMPGGPVPGGPVPDGQGLPGHPPMHMPPPSLAPAMKSSAPRRSEPMTTEMIHDALVDWIADEADPVVDPDSLPGLLRHLSYAWNLRDEPNILLVHYDNLIADLPGQMRWIAGRLGITVPEEVWPSLIEAATFAQMRERAEDLIPTPPGAVKDPAAFFRRGTSGAGEELLSEKELAAYHERVAQLAPADMLEWLHSPSGQAS